jgi:hypothetical protein
MFDHFWDFDRLVEDEVPKWSYNHGILLVLQARVNVMGYVGTFIFGIINLTIFD